MTRVNWTIAVPLIVAVIGAGVALWQARTADKRARDADTSASATKTIEIGVTDLVNQYREANEELRDEVHHLAERCRELTEAMRVLETQIAQFKKELDVRDTQLDDAQSEIIRLRRRLGDLP